LNGSASIGLSNERSPMTLPPNEIRRCLRPERLLDLARRLIAIPSPTGRAGEALDALAGYLKAEGFTVERPNAGHPEAPAVVARLDSGRPGRTLQWDGHLDTVHLPFVADRVEGNLLRGSGASDMKGGLAAAVEALLVLRDSRLLMDGSVLLTAHDLHEAPWGRGEQFDRMILDGIIGDAVLIPEPFCEELPIVGRGQACWKVVIRRPGPPVHEVMRPLDEPEVLTAGAILVERLSRFDQSLRREDGPMGLSPSVFVGRFQGGEIYNGFPQECVLEGTRRWLPGSSCEEADHEFRAIVDETCKATGATVDIEFQQVRDAFALSSDDPIVDDFQASMMDSIGRSLPFGKKPFVDDGNSVYGLAKRPAITHGPRAGGQHTLEEWVDIDDLNRVAITYALTAIRYCARGTDVDNS
jgi:acetylornithine deacetylase/succinyl-diaminopimelate desuccinylase-like protein